MKNNAVSSQATKIITGVLVAALVPNASRGCACGCGIFDVGTGTMLPSGAGWTISLNYDYQDQDHNWNGRSEAPNEDNSDKEIETRFTSIEVRYMFNRDWGLQAEVPYDFRHFVTTDDSGKIVTRNWNQLGDVRIKGIYTGFFQDLSAGVTLGLKLPTGSYTFDPDIVDRDTQLGTGSTDLLIGAFYRHNLISKWQLQWFAQAEADQPFLIKDQYRPGFELDAAVGTYYTGLSLGPVRVSPVAQVLFSERTSDSGANSANPVASGYQRVLLSPGVEFHLHPVALYADAEFPVFQNFTGNQVAAPFLLKVVLSFAF